MAYVTKRELDLTPEEKEALLYLSRQLGMQDNYAIVTFDEDALRDAMAPAATAVTVVESSVVHVQAEAEGEEEAPPVPVVTTSSLPELVGQEVEQETTNDEGTTDEPAVS